MEAFDWYNEYQDWQQYDNNFRKEKSMNEIKISGRLVKDPDIKHIANGKMIANYTIAVNHTKEKVSFFDIISWDDMAQLISEKKKGELVSIIGYLQQNRWIGKDGKNNSKIEITATGFIGNVKASLKSHDNNQSPIVDPWKNEAPENNESNYKNDDDVPF
jgi:single-strand DNA-binding protein